MKTSRLSMVAVLAVAVFIAVMASIACAAVAEDNGGLNMQNAGYASIVIAIGLLFNGLANIGSIVFFAKRYMSKVDRTDETLPAIMATLEATKNAMEQQAKSIGELYGTRNSHEIKLARIETIHQMRGCDKGVEAHTG